MANYLTTTAICGPSPNSCPKLVAHICIGCLCLLYYFNLPSLEPSDPNMLHHDYALVHCARFIMTWFTKFEVEEIKWPAHSPHLNPSEYLWDRWEYQLCSGTLSVTSLPALTNALAAE